MRIRQLSLIRYGHFEDTILSFPRDEHDIHVVYGENEAGKSTALRALGDVLFEFPTRTTMAFRFPMPKLRIGATLELDDEVFEFVRYKKRLDSIKDADGNDILDGEKTLKRFLANADRELFERLFLLDHDRLQAGARELLAGGGDAGEAMLASSAGLEGLHELLATLNEETDGLWAPAASKKRQFYIAKDALDTAVRERREHTIEPREWKRVREAVTHAREQYDQMVEALRDKRAERSRLDRIRRLWGDLNRLATAEKELADLGDPVLMDEGAVELLRQARTEFNAIEGRIENHEGRIQKLEAGIADLPIDENLLSRADDLEALNERRVSLRQYGEDLPRRRITRTTLEERISSLARDLGWSDMDANVIATRLPTKPLIDKARSLVVAHTKLTTERDGLDSKQKDALREQERLEKVVKELAAVVDLTELAAAVGAADKQRSLTDERRHLEVDVKQRTALLEQTLRPMSPSFAGEEQLAATLLPDRAAVDGHRDAHRACHSTLKELRDDARELAQRIETEREEIEAERENIGAMSEADLQAARTARDDAWGLLATRYLHGEKVDRNRWQELFGEDDSGEHRYSALVEAADEGADVRFTHAHEVGALASKEAARTKLERDLAALHETIEATEAGQATLNEAWSALWQGCPVLPPDPDNGVVWLEQAMRCKELLEDLTTKREALTSVRESEDAARAALSKILSTFISNGEDIAERGLDELIELGKEMGRTLRSNNDEREKAEDALEMAGTALAEANVDLDAQDAKLGHWKEMWGGVLKSLNLDAKTTPDELDSYLSAIEELREKTRELVDNINDRIEKMEGALARFSEDVRALADALAYAESDAEPADLVTVLVAQLRQCQSHAEQRDRDTKTIDEEQRAIAELRDAQRDHRETIERLAGLAGTANDDDLTRAASNSDRRRELAATVETLVGAIEKNGDGKSLAELQNEAADVDLDAANARVQQLDEEIEALDNLFPERRDALTTAEKALESIGTDSDAARFELVRQQALADMGEVAERYVRTATASALLRWSIDRFRIQNQKPLLDRASQLFGLLTRGSFERIVIEFDTEEQPVLAGRRPSGETTSLEGMSSGSQDQLFLALRLAAVDDYAAKASAMPFVGDDLFIRHDENRTREALVALTELSKTCQVILFSHSRAFLALAREALPARANVIELEPIPSAGHG